MANTSAPLLDLDELAERRTVRIKKQDYELRNPGEISPFDNYRLIQLWNPVVHALNKDAEASEEEMVAAENSLEAIVRRVLMAPEDVQAALSVKARWQIAQGFFTLLRDEGARLLAEANESADAPQAVPAPVPPPWEVTKSLLAGGAPAPQSPPATDLPYATEMPAGPV